MKNTIKLILVTASVALLAACGGGGGEQVTEESIPNAVVLVSLSNSQGVARFTSNDSVGLIYFPQISDFVSGFNTADQNNDSSGIANLNPSSFPIISTTASTETRRGTITADGSTINVTALKNNLTNNAFGIYLELPNDADGYIVAGDSISQVPVTGTAVFSGAFTQNARSVIAPGEVGSFSLNVNYTQRTFSITATTNATSFVGNGVIDLSNGLFASSTANFSRNGVNYPASIYGNLVGNGASSVVGVFYTSDTSPDYAGTFFGSK